MMRHYFWLGMIGTVLGGLVYHPCAHGTPPTAPEQIAWRSRTDDHPKTDPREPPSQAPAARLGAPKASLGRPAPAASTHKTTSPPVTSESRKIATPEPVEKESNVTWKSAATLARPVARAQDNIPEPLPISSPMSGLPIDQPRKLQPPMITEEPSDLGQTPGTQPGIGSPGVFSGAPPVVTPFPPHLGGPPIIAPTPHDHLGGPMEGPPVVYDEGAVPYLGGGGAFLSDGACCDTGCGVGGGCGSPHMRSLGLGCCSGCGNRLERWYASGEYLMWWANRNNYPPLVTTGLPASQGIIGFPGTMILQGGDGRDLVSQQRHGGRFRVGHWLDSCGLWALEGSIFFLGREQSTSTFSSSTTPLLARPFFNPNPNVVFDGFPSPGNLSEIIAFPGALNGTMQIDASSEVWGAEANLRRNLWDGCRLQINAISGFRYLHLDESVRLTETIIADPRATDPQIAGFAGVITDEFRTRNDFFGGQVGIDGEVNLGRWSLGMFAKVAMGNTRQQISIDGSQTFTRPGEGINFVNGGLLAIPGANIGQFERNRFSVVPEVGFNISCHLTPQLRAFVGYNFLYWSNVVRSGDQIDTVVDAARVPTFAPPGSVPLMGVRPTVPFRESDLWLQGISFGLSYTW